jgi:hypothetical protein
MFARSLKSTPAAIVVRRGEISTKPSDCSRRNASRIQTPPRAVATPRAFSALAMVRNDVAPLAFTCSMTGRTLAAKRIGIRLVGGNAAPLRLLLLRAAAVMVRHFRLLRGAQGRGRRAEDAMHRPGASARGVWSARRQCRVFARLRRQHERCRALYETRLTPAFNYTDGSKTGGRIYFSVAASLAWPQRCLAISRLPPAPVAGGSNTTATTCNAVMKACDASGALSSGTFGAG